MRLKGWGDTALAKRLILDSVQRFAEHPANF
jgi:hypothetical protein